jgi:hypothetical protein
MIFISKLEVMYSDLHNYCGSFVVINIVEDLKMIGVNDWRNIIHNREKRREVVMAEKTLVE